MRQAMQRGGHCRVGFENNLLMSDGSQAEDNAALVKVIEESALLLDLTIAKANDARRLLGMY